MKAKGKWGKAKVGRAVREDRDSEGLVEKWKTYCEGRCDCGTVRTFQAANLRQRRTSSCGCVRVQMTIDKNSIHG
jgi:hypothetical protein